MPVEVIELASARDVLWGIVMRARLALAHLTLVSVLASGCFGDHGLSAIDAGRSDDAARESDAPAPEPDASSAPDAASLPDAGDCRLEPGFVSGLRCGVLPDGTAVATLVGASHGGCCASAVPSPSVAIAGTSITVDLEFTACSCCDTCPCLSPAMDLDVSLGALAPGSYTVSSAGQTCELTIGPAPMCVVADATETRMPLFLYADQEFAATIVADPASQCGCTPEVSPISATSTDLRLQLCSCCLVCDCVATPSYEASVVGPVLPLGETSLSIPHGAASITVVPRGGTHDVPVTGLRVVGPDPTRTRGGPALWWVDVSGTDALCCATSMPLIDQTMGAAGEIDLAVASAAVDPCDCLGLPQPFDAWHSLGELASGNYTVVAGSQTASFTVP